jgi:predicted RNA-binding protein with PIN domain
MHYLIDGHNLISQLPDISLDDPYDEAKLVLSLRKWAAAGRKRQATIIFDGGLPGGNWGYMSRGQVKATFASAGHSADELLVNRVRQAKNPAEFTLVTSDREILAEAKACRMPFMTSESFSKQLQKSFGDQSNNAEEKAIQSEEPDLSQEELSEWLDIFQTASAAQDEIVERDSVSPTFPKTTTVAKESPEEEARPKVEPVTLKKGTRKLSSDEVDEWMALFAKDEEK